MPIVFACADCAHSIKAPDEMAGRRVKCPSCKEPQRVPEDATPAAPEAVRETPRRRPAAPPPNDPDVAMDETPRRRRPSQDDDDAPRRRPREDDDDRPRRARADDDERPRRRPERTESGNKGLIIGLLIGGGLLVIGGVVLVILLMSSGEGGDGKGGPAGGGGGRPVLDPNLRANLQQIGLAYHNYYDSFRKAPSRAEDLLPFLEGGGPPFDRLRSGEIVFIYNVGLREMTAGSSNTVLAYERNVPARGGWVLFGDASVRSVTQAEFQASPKATPK